MSAAKVSTRVSQPRIAFWIAAARACRQLLFFISFSFFIFQIQKRSKVRPFLKLVNYSHVMPTRYQFFGLP
jgi:hypothetical protein